MLQLSCRRSRVRSPVGNSCRQVCTFFSGEGIYSGRASWFLQARSCFQVSFIHPLPGLPRCTKSLVAVSFIRNIYYEVRSIPYCNFKIHSLRFCMQSASGAAPELTCPVTVTLSLLGGPVFNKEMDHLQKDWLVQQSTFLLPSSDCILKGWATPGNTALLHIALVN